MSYVEGLSAVLAQVSQIQSVIASPPSLAPTDFASVLAQVSSVSQVGGAPASASPDLSDSYGWPLEEGKDIYPASPAASPVATSAASSAAGSPTGTPTASPLAAPAIPRVMVYDERTMSAVPAVSAGSPGLSAGTAPISTSGAGQAADPAADLGQAAVTDAQKYLGVPYVWGGTSRTQGVDCSGLVQDVYSDIGINLPRTSQEQATVGVPVASLAQAQPGDLVFFPGSDGTAAAPGHVGIYLGNGQMIDAPYTGADVRVDPVGNPTSIRRVTGMSDGANPSAANLASSSPSPAAVPSGSASGATVQTAAASSQATSAASPYDADFASASATYGVPENLLRAVAGAESAFQPGAVSSAGAEGLMQLMPAVASSLGVDAFNPSQAIGAAAHLLSSYYGQFGSWPLALAAYNAGPGAVEENSGVPPYAQTTAYVSSVLANAGMEEQ